MPPDAPPLTCQSPRALPGDSPTVVSSGSAHHRQITLVVKLMNVAIATVQANSVTTSSTLRVENRQIYIKTRGARGDL